MDINTCFETTNYYHTIAYYAHLVPVALALLLSTYALLKTRFSKLSVIFFLFTLSFSLWLLNDLILWTNQSYLSIYFFWSWIDYVNIIFFALGAYFFGVLVRGRVSIFEKILTIAVCVTAFVLTVTGNAVTDFNQPVCEVLENSVITTYKLFAEGAFVALMLFSYVAAWRASDRQKRVQTSIVLFAMLLFFGVFSSTEYIATVTDIYEINLYGLFVLPLFLIIMVFSITNLGIFQIRFLGTQLLVYTLLIMIGSQFLFLQSTTDAALNGITLVTAILFSLLLLRNTKRELEARVEIERLALDLQTANKGQETLIHIMNHQIKGYLGRARIIFHELLSGGYGVIPEKAQPPLAKGLETAADGVAYVQSILRGASAAQGTLPYDMRPIDLKPVVAEVVAEQQDAAKEQGLSLTADIEGGDYRMTGDAVELREAFKNLVTNAIKYNVPKGSIAVALRRTDEKIVLSVKDTGRGIPEEDRSRIFTTGGMGTDSLKYNPDAAGFGLAFVKGVVEHHHGRVWYESNAPEQGTTFWVEVSTGRKG